MLKVMVIDNQVICKEAVVRTIPNRASLDKQKETHARVRSSARWEESLIMPFITPIKV